MQSLKDLEDLIGIFIFKTNTIIAEFDLVMRYTSLQFRMGGGFFRAYFPAKNFNHRWLFWITEFEGIAEQVLEELAHLQRHRFY